MNRIRANRLAKENGIDVRHALYRKSGDWYHVLKRFPAALFDRNGFIKFPTKDEYDSFISLGKDAGIYHSLESNTLTINGGIASHAEYVPFTDLSLFPDEIPIPSVVTEGAYRQVSVNSYERDVSARKPCLQKWGVNCSVCNFHFEETYGDIGKGFIHVHHLVPLSSIGKEYVLIPESDLRPVCPNCHAMLHKRKPPYSIEELRTILNRKASV